MRWACSFFTLNSVCVQHMCASNTRLRHWSHLFTPAKIHMVPLCPSVNILCDSTACLSSSVSLSLFLCVQEYKESPRSERISHSERGEDRHGLPSAEDHVSSDSEGNHDAIFIHAHKNTKCGEKQGGFLHSWSSFTFPWQCVKLDVIKHMLLRPLQNFGLTFRHPKITSTTSTFSCIRIHRLLLEVQLQWEIKMSRTDVSTTCETSPVPGG